MPGNRNKRILCAANRLPVSIDSSDIVSSPGGLASALDGLKKEASLHWIGWPGITGCGSGHCTELVTRLQERLDCTPVFLSGRELEEYYYGFSNSTLWPVLHNMPDRLRYSRKMWNGYEAVNHRFAQTISEQAQPGDLVWIHDYHLMLVPQILRETRPGLRVGFFLHTPFPPSEIFKCIPRNNRLLDGLLGADVLGFHTFGYTRHFRSAVLRLLGVDPEMEYISSNSRKTFVGVFPIGINTDLFTSTLGSDEYRSCLARYRDIYKGKKIILNVERLDYTKGLSRKLEAIESFLAGHSEPDKVVFIFVCVPSRGNVYEYRILRENIEQKVGLINGRHSTVENVPVHFIHQSLEMPELCALYSLADVGLVTPLADGMNLVAKEYVACREKEPGVLILSEFAGAAQELCHAITVNPYCSDEIVSAIEEALALPENTKTRWMEFMKRRVLKFDSVHWGHSFLEALETKDTDVDTPLSSTDSTKEILRRCVGAEHLALFLDYDGTLRPFMKDPDTASPAENTLSLLETAAELPGTDIFIISGRKMEDLEAWFCKSPCRLIAEHGYEAREPGGKPFILSPDIDHSWKDYVREIFLHYEDNTPGSHIEEKNSSLVWHYRRSDPEFAVWKAQQLVAEIHEVISNFPVEVHHGNRIIEVRSLHQNKGTAVEYYLKQNKYDTALCAGDDQTDESMFLLSRPEIVSLKVGTGDTAADFRIENPENLHELLKKIMEQRKKKPSHNREAAGEKHMAPAHK